MKKSLVWVIVIVAIILILVGSIYGWFKGTYNNLVNLEEQVNGSWAQVENVYQRRYDLIPNLVETVRGYMEHERETLTRVTEARSKVGGVLNLKAEDLSNPQLLQQFQQAQAGLSGALQRLMVVVERYPDLKANQNFIRLQDELAGTENRIAVERRRFNESVLMLNRTIRQFPVNILANMFGFSKKAYFEAEEGAARAPEVEF
jgi:LemA protein